MTLVLAKDAAISLTQTGGGGRSMMSFDDETTDPTYLYGPGPEPKVRQCLLFSHTIIGKGPVIIDPSVIRLSDSDQDPGSFQTPGSPFVRSSVFVLVFDFLLSIMLAAAPKG